MSVPLGSSHVRPAPLTPPLAPPPQPVGPALSCGSLPILPHLARPAHRPALQGGPVLSGLRGLPQQLTVSGTAARREPQQLEETEAQRGQKCDWGPTSGREVGLGGSCLRSTVSPRYG